MGHLYVSSAQRDTQALDLGRRVISDGFEPDYIIGVLRGGYPIALMVQRTFADTGQDIPIVAIGAASYGKSHTSGNVRLYGLEELQQIEFHRSNQGKSRAERILIVDDILETGKTRSKLEDAITHMYEGPPPEMRLAVLYDKPVDGRAEASYWLERVPKERWIIWPHEPGGKIE